MSAWINKQIKRRGFSLIELLIVVAIIGVLSTIGIPTFKKLVAKSKKSEAKVSLGGLYTVETAFLTEYAAYGNVLSAIGYDDPKNSYYTTGFMSSACVSSSYAPSTGTGYTAINAAIPTYSTNAITRYTSTTAPTACPTSSTMATDGSTFTASASGPISSGASGNATATGNACGTTCQDVWTMDQARVLSNTLDGAY